MGYESKFFIVEKSSLKCEETGGVWAEIIAEFNFCKAGSNSRVRAIIRSAPVSNCYVCIGDDVIFEDKYGDPLKEIQVDDLVNALLEDSHEEDKKGGGIYRRIMPLKALLSGFNKDQWEELVILHYGY